MAKTVREQAIEKGHPVVGKLKRHKNYEYYDDDGMKCTQRQYVDEEGTWYVTDSKTGIIDYISIEGIWVI